MNITESIPYYERETYLLDSPSKVPLLDYLIIPRNGTVSSSREILLACS